MLLATHPSSRALLALVSLLAADPAVAQHLDDPALKSEVLRLIHAVYFREVVLDTSLPVDALVASLDPHSEYVAQSDAQSRIAELDAARPVGFGLWTQRVGTHVIVDFVDPYDCAARAGMLAGDELLAISGTPVDSLSDEKLEAVLYDAANWAFEANIYRRSTRDTLRFWISRNYSAPFRKLTYFGMIDDSTGYIKFEMFGVGVAAEIRRALDTLRQRGMTSCILDLRDNYGGLVNEAVAVEDIFVSGHVRMISTRSLHIEQEDTIYAGAASPYESMPLTVLVNHNTWSAAELLSGSLQDLDRATIVGEATGGKALVMRYYPLSNGDQVLLTVAGAILPSGRCAQALYHNGIYDVSPPTLPAGVNDHTADALYTQMPCRYFTTAHGRPVSWHEGIIPDIVIGEVESYAPTGYYTVLDSVAILRVRDSIAVYRQMGLDRFITGSHYAPTTLNAVEQRLEALDTTRSKHEALSREPGLERALTWRIAFRIWQADATLRCFTRRLPIVRRAWIEPRVRMLTGAAQ